ncbi:DNA-processing protein DprA [Saprospiraceae bacterium]|jgi:DNA processing protein|nr:DNA-processing protein DprA [Saprospiraceae bacterium]
MTDLLYKIALTKIHRVGAITAKNLISYSGGAEAVFKSSKKALMKVPGIGESTAQEIVSQNVLLEAEMEAEFIEKHEIRPIFYLDKDYPQRLKHYHDCPLMLFYKGTANLNHHRIIGIVGTRKPSSYGTAICEELVSELAPYQPLVVSGLAYGIDVTAHRKSVEMGLQTIGVMGNGLARIYPPQHQKVAYEMVENGGLLTEFTSNVMPDRENFPMRNRIVAGLCDGLVVVETAKKGGSMITARMAHSYHKPVFAVPGRVKDKMAKGCNILIKEGKAQLVENASDIVQTLNWDMGEEENIGRQAKLFVPLTDEETKIIDLLQNEEEADIDKLSIDTKIDHSKLASILLEMELKGMVRMIPGKRFILT